jgi:GNAT superfamily N-acetyltransferase
VWSGCYGPVIDDASAMILRDELPCAAIAVTESRGVPLIGHLVTAETERGRGLARILLVESLRRLVRSGYHDCRLNVAEENWVAHRLYRSIGFTRWHPTLQASLLVAKGAGHVA